MANFNSIITKLTEDSQSAAARGTAEAYSRLSTILEELDGYFRESMQNLTEDGIREVIRKLRHGGAITEEDRSLLRLWIIDDAKRYIESEHNFDDWQETLKGLLGEISRYKDREADAATASELRGMMRRTAGVVADIFYYLQQQDRIARFEQVSQDPGPKERSLLIGLLEQKIKSSEL